MNYLNSIYSSRRHQNLKKISPWIISCIIFCCSWVSHAAEPIVHIPFHEIGNPGGNADEDARRQDVKRLARIAHASINEDDNTGPLGNPFSAVGFSKNAFLSYNMLDTTFSEATVSIWVRFDDKGSGNDYVFDTRCGQNSVADTAYIFLNGDTLHARFSNSETLAVPNIQLNRWTHIAMVSQAGKIELYVDGEIMASKTFLVNPITPITLKAFRLGDFCGAKLLDDEEGPAQTQWRINASFHDFKIYDVALSRSEVVELVSPYASVPSEIANISLDGNVDESDDATFELDSGNSVIPGFSVGGPNNTLYADFNHSEPKHLKYLVNLGSDIGTTSHSLWANIQDSPNNNNYLIDTRGGDTQYILHNKNKLKGYCEGVDPGEPMEIDIAEHIGDWMHVVLSCNAEGSESYLYANGKYAYSSSAPKSITLSEYHIGNYQNGSYHYSAKAKLADVRIYNSPLNHLQVAAIANNLIEESSFDKLIPVAYFPLQTHVENVVLGNNFEEASFDEYALPAFSAYGPNGKNYAKFGNDRSARYLVDDEILNAISFSAWLRVTDSPDNLENYIFDSSIGAHGCSLIHKAGELIATCGVEELRLDLGPYLTQWVRVSFVAGPNGSRLFLNKEAIVNLSPVDLGSLAEVSLASYIAGDYGMLGDMSDVVITDTELSNDQISMLADYGFVY